MEFTEGLILIMTIFSMTSVSIFLYKYFGNNDRKLTRKPKTESISETNYKQIIKDMQETYGQQITQIKKDRYRLQGIINRNQMNLKSDDDDDDDEFDSSQYVFDKEMVRPMLANWGMNADALENPMLQQMILDKVKGNEELLITLGILRNRNHTKPEIQHNEQIAPFAAETAALIASGNWA